MKANFSVMNTSEVVVKIRPEKIQACMGFEPMTSDSGAVHYQLSWQVNWELVIMLDLNEPVKWWINDYEYMKIIYWYVNWSYIFMVIYLNFVNHVCRWILVLDKLK